MYSVYVPNPNVQRVSAAFEKIINPDFASFIFFSDDACAGFRCSDGVLKVNLDISGCDGSHTERIFDVCSNLVQGTAHEETMKWLILQCMLPLNFKEENVQMKFSPKSPVLYSGSTMTTFVNNIGISVIADELEKAYSPTLTMDEMLAMIPIACASVGYLVTCQRCDHVEDLQFLKMSPVFTLDGTLSCCLNLGVILRTLGQCSGDIPGRKGTLVARATAFNASVVAGLKHAGNHSLTHALRRKYPASNSTPIYSSYLTAQLSGRCEGLDELSLLKRYRISSGEWDELLSIIDASEIGDILWCPAFDKVMCLDYGLTT